MRWTNFGGRAALWAAGVGLSAGTWAGTGSAAFGQAAPDAPARPAGESAAAPAAKDGLADEVRALRDEVAKLRADQERQRQELEAARAAAANAGEAAAKAGDTAAKASAAASSRPAADADYVRKAVDDAVADAKKRGSIGGSGEKWYDKLSLRGYTQLRYYPVVNADGAALNVPNDRPVAEDTHTLYIRRGRFILSGDVSEHLSLYAQVDWFGSVSSDLDLSLQTRDLYADVFIDKQKEYRVRLGQSKVPYGFVNLQSSQNRAPMERPDSINSAVEGERDIGVYFMWAPEEARKRFRELVSSGLKGSGDYGVVAVGVYSGQGLNRGDVNGEPHVVARASYPFKLDNGQFFEAGVQAYTGRFFSSVGSVPAVVGTGNVTPVEHDRGVLDQRVGVSAVWYPQPFGVEAEWNVGRGPQLSDDRRTIEDEFLHGGYVMLNYRHKDSRGNWFPFVRWQYYEGGRKFARNAPHEIVNELDVGLEWSPWPELELTLMYTHSFDRTDTRAAPYAQATGERVGIQVQFNY